MAGSGLVADVADGWQRMAGGKVTSPPAYRRRTKDSNFFANRPSQQLLALGIAHK